MHSSIYTKPPPTSSKTSKITMIFATKNSTRENYVLNIFKATKSKVYIVVTLHNQELNVDGFMNTIHSITIDFFIRQRGTLTSKQENLTTSNNSCIIGSNYQFMLRQMAIKENVWYASPFKEIQELGVINYNLNLLLEY